MKDNAYTIFKSITHKKRFAIAVANHCKKDDGTKYTYESILQNWLYPGSIPEKHYRKVLSMAQKFKAIENEYDRKMQLI